MNYNIWWPCFFFHPDLCFFVTIMSSLSQQPSCDTPSPSAWHLPWHVTPCDRSGQLRDAECGHPETQSTQGSGDNSVNVTGEALQLEYTLGDYNWFVLVVLVRRLDILTFLDTEVSVLSIEILGVRSKVNSFESQFIASLGQGQARQPAVTGSYWESGDRPVAWEESEQRDRGYLTLTWLRYQ